LEFSDWGLSPTQKVASRSKALDDYINIAQPATEKQEGRERGQLAEDTYQQSVQAARGGNAQQGSEVLAKAQQLAAEKVPEQAVRQDDLNFQGSMQKEAILSAKQEAAVAQYNRNTAEYKDKTATALANKAFEQGYNSKELAMSNNGYLSDKGFEQAAADYEAGRLTAKEIQDMQNALKLRTNDLRNQIAAEMADLKQRLKVDLSKQDLMYMKDRYEKLMQMQKDAIGAAAKGSMWGSILSGVFGIAGGIAGAYLGGPTGGAVGVKLGNKIGEGAYNAAN